MGNKVKKVPVIMQMEALECGAASLAMILAYHGKWVPLEQVRSDCGVSRDGSSAKNILAAAQNYGMDAKGYRMDIGELKKMPFPCIIHWNFNHFVVLNGFHGKKAVINDPARGRVEAPMEEFDASYTGICLTFEPGGAFMPGGHKKSILRFAAARMKGMLPPVLFVILTGILTSCVGVVYPAFGRIFLDRILTHENSAWLGPLVGFMLLTALLHFIVSLVQTFYMLKIEGKLAIVANTSFIWHVLRLPMEFYSQRLAGDIADRQQSNEGIASTLVNELAPVALDFALLAVYYLVMARYSLLLTAVGLGAALFNIFMANLISRKRIHITRVQFRDQGKLSAATVGGIDMIETIKSSGAENGYFERWAGYQAAVNTATVRFARLNQYLGAVPGFLLSLANGTVLLLGVWQIMRGSFTVGMLLAFQGYLSAFMTPFGAIISAGQNVQEMRSLMERIEDVMEYPVDDAPEERGPVREMQRQAGSAASPSGECGSGPVREMRGGPRERRGLSGALSMKDVTFGYSRLSKPLIENFNLELEAGKSVAFVGATGCGKSTLAKLITGLYKPWSGEISFDGVPSGEIPREVLTGSVASVDQDVVLFEDTILANIRMWDTSIEDSKVLAAARDAQIYEDIMERENGFGCRILENGKDFSGGQRQRLEIARALAQEPSLIILDEATSALDAATEYEVMKAVGERKISCVIIAHRLSTIRDCDEILVLDHGRVAERGNHGELMKKNGLYRALVTSR